MDPLRPPAPRTGPPAPLAGTVGTLPAGTPVKIHEMPEGVDVRWLVELDPDQSDAGRLEHTWTYLDHPVRPYIWAGMGTPDPAVDLSGFLRARWWDPDAALDHLAMILRMEAAGLIHHWDANTHLAPL